MNKRLFGIMASVVAISVILTALLTYQITNTLYLSGHIGFGFGVDQPHIEVHAQITFWKGTTLLWSQYHAGVVTNLGDNMTIFKLFGSTSYKYGVIDYHYNATYISIGNQGTLNTGSTVLPGEWNRTTGAIEVIGQSQINITATFYPDASGPYTADCIGLNFNGTAGAHNLWGYDTWTPENTGIDDTFTINVEFSVTVSNT